MDKRDFLVQSSGQERNCSAVKWTKKIVVEPSGETENVVQSSEQREIVVQSSGQRKIVVQSNRQEKNYSAIK